MPPEWAAQEAVWLGWPQNPRIWPGRRDAALKAFALFAATISRFETVRILCRASNQAQALDSLSAAGANMHRVELFDIPSDEAWCRDYGPIFLKNPKSGERAILDFSFNSWGAKFPPWDVDDAVPEKVAETLNIPRFKSALVCEGGAIEVNGEGVLLTTESVILNPNRNPGVDKASAEKILMRHLGLEQVLWLESGMLWDDTDGHIDTLARFFRPEAVLAATDEDISSPNHAPLKRNFEALKGFCLHGGSRLEVLPLPCPKPIRPAGWRLEVLPASYTNFLIVNGAVIVPTYRQDDSDRNALDTIGQCFPGRKIVPIDCFDIVFEGGALHCLSQQQPA